GLGSGRVRPEGWFEGRRIDPLTDFICSVAFPFEVRIANQIAPARPNGAAEVSIRELVTGAEDRLRETGLGIEICGELPTANNLIQNAPPVQQRFAGSKRQLVGHGDIQDLRDIISCNRTISLPVVRVTE